MGDRRVYHPEHLILLLGLPVENGVRDILDLNEEYFLAVEQEPNHFESHEQFLLSLSTVNLAKLLGGIHF